MRPIDTPALNVITIAPIVFGYTGVIFLTGALVQFITLSQRLKRRREGRADSRGSDATAASTKRYEDLAPSWPS